MAEADDEERPSPKFTERPAAPAALAQVPVGSEQLPVERRHNHEHVLRDPIVVPVDVRNPDTGRDRAQLDAVVAGADGVDEAQFRHVCRPVGLEDPAHEDVRVADGREHLVAALRRGGNDLGRDGEVLPEAVGEGRERGDSQRRHGAIVAVAAAPCEPRVCRSLR